MTGIKKAQLTIIAPTGAKFAFVHTTGDMFSVDIEGGEKFVGEINAGNIQNQIVPLTLNITNYDTTGSGSGNGKNTGSTTSTSTTTTILTTATATATSMLMMKSSYKQYTPFVIGAGMAAAILPNFDTVLAATCSAPSVTITLPIKNNNRDIYFDLRQAQVTTAVCPDGYVFHPVNGCSEFRSIYQRVYVNGTGCADVAPIDLTVTSAQGDYITLSDTMMIPFTTNGFYGSSLTKFNTTLSNGQQAAVTAWTAPDYGIGFVAIDFTTSTLTCKAAYNCISGECTDQQKAGSTRCASYSFTSNSTYCYTRNVTGFPTPPPGSACPALSCDAWCPNNATPNGASCSLASCPSNIQLCTSRCFCPNSYPMNNAFRTMTPAYASASSFSIIIMLIAANVAINGIGCGMGMGMDAE